MFRHSRSVLQRGTRALHAGSSAKSGGYVRFPIYLLLMTIKMINDIVDRHCGYSSLIRLLVSTHVTHARVFGMLRRFHDFYLP
jgi:hypothetical protein